MDFEYSQKEVAFRNEVAKFVEAELAPGAIDRDKNERFDEAADIILNKMGPKGWLGLTMPEQYGGIGGSFVDLCIAVVEFARKDVSVASAYSVSVTLGTIPILKFGSGYLKEKYLPPLFKGEQLCAFGLTELGAGSDAAMQETTAEQNGDDYILNGSKVYITNASIAKTYVVIAMTDKSAGTKGISAFVVERGVPGFTFGNVYETCGIRGTIQRELVFENCKIPKENLIGEEGKGFKYAMTALDYGRLCVAAQGLGCAKGSFDIALTAAKERVQFGKRIIDNQIIAFMLSDMETKIELGELLLMKAARMFDLEKPITKYTAMAKKYCTNLAQEITTKSVQILGGKGYLRENEVERFYRDSKILQIYEGTNQIQDVVLSSLLMK